MNCPPLLRTRCPAVTGRSGGTARPKYLRSGVDASGGTSTTSGTWAAPGSQGLGGVARGCSMSSWKERHTARYSSFDNARDGRCRSTRASASRAAVRHEPAGHGNVRGCAPFRQDSATPGIGRLASWSTGRRTAGAVVVERLPLGCGGRRADIELSDVTNPRDLRTLVALRSRICIRII